MTTSSRRTAGPGRSRLPRTGGSRVEIIGVRHLRGLKGRLLTPVSPLGVAKRSVADHLRHFLSKVEEQHGTVTLTAAVEPR